MKKITALLLCLCLSLSLIACADVGQNETKPSDTAATQDSGPTADGERFSFVYNGTKIALFAPAEPIIDALGEPKNYTESPSCAFNGMDKTYFYGSFYMDTYPMDGKDYVYGWWFADDSVSTGEGIYIGATQAEVEKAYGADSFNGDNAYAVTKNDGTLTVIVEEGVVTSIQYAIILN